MTTNLTAKRRRRGIAAVEFALVLPFLLMLLMLPLYFGRVFWHYAALQKATQNAVRYLASVPATTMKNPVKVGYAVQLANEIAQQHLQELNPGPYPMIVTVQCDGVTCDGLATPSTVRVFTRARVEDIFFPDSDTMSILVTADATIAYVGK